jgi:2-oxoglutarate dehydrogenase E1 component
MTLCARNNLRVTMPSTSAQYFHLLRAQVRRTRATPLVVFTPKSQLRAATSRSRIAELAEGRFFEVLDDASVADPSAVRSILLASGKVAHEAVAHRARLVDHGELADGAVAIVRVEQLYPWPADALAAVLDHYGGAQDVCWLQEEPENMGPWPFVHHQLHRSLRDSHVLRHVARAESASPATGSGLVHEAEQADLLRRALS